MMIKGLSIVNLALYYVLTLSLFMGIQVTGRCQSAPALNKLKYPPALHIISSRKTLDSTVSQDSSKKMVDLFNSIPGLKLDLRYATKNNFLGKEIYPEAAAYLRRSAEERLAEAEKEFLSMGLTLRFFDAYRSYTATILIYSSVGDTDYAASPQTGSRHNRGCSVDCSLENIKTGIELSMPTPFDSFSERAHSNFMMLDSSKLNHRALLKRIMEKHGFVQLKTEWWHFDYAAWKKYELLDLSFRDLKN